MINRITLNKDLKRGEIFLRANQSNQNIDTINEVVKFLNEHPEVTKVNFSFSFILPALANKLAMIDTVKEINLYNHAYVSWAFYSTASQYIIDKFQQKTGRDEAPTRQQWNTIFASKHKTQSTIETSLDDIFRIKIHK